MIDLTQHRPTLIRCGYLRCGTLGNKIVFPLREKKIFLLHKIIFFLCEEKNSSRGSPHAHLKLA